MLSGTWFKDSDGSWYYFSNSGHMLADTYTPDNLHVNASGVWVENAKSSSKLTDHTSNPTTVYEEGTYRAGVDVPAGEYVAFFKKGKYPEWQSLYVKVMKSDNESVIKYNIEKVGTSNIIFRVKEGELFTLERGTFSPIGEVPNISYTKALNSEITWLKVGTHIPAGRYKLSAKDNSGLKSFKIYKYREDGHMNLEKIEFLQKGGSGTYKNDVTIELKNDEYLVLEDIILELQ